MGVKILGRAARARTEGGASRRGRPQHNVSRNSFNSQALEARMAVQQAEREDSPSSRVHYISESYAVRMHWVRRIISFFKVDPDLVIDGFSTNANKRFKLNITEVDDSFADVWPSSHIMWLNPPWTVFPRVVQKIAEDKVTCIVICPAWDSKPWVRQLLSWAQKMIFFETGSKVNPPPLIMTRVL